MPWSGKLLRIDLSKKTSRTEQIPEKILAEYLGGKGLATRYFAYEVSPKADALSAQNKLFFAPGAFSGTTAPASSRFHVVTKSPLTGIYLDCSSGGHFGPELRNCGIDLMIIEGQAEKLTGLSIENDTVQFLDAESYRGMGIYDTEKKLLAKFGKKRVRTASIGKAGEQQVRYACISNDFSRNIGRGGAGAVMGSKNLKFIAVHGTEPVQAANQKAFLEAVRISAEWISNNPWVAGTRAHGTAGNVDAMSRLGVWPVWNFSGKEFPGAAKINHESLEKKLVKRLSCANCPVSCSKGYRDDTYTNGEVEGPEYETLSLLGSNIGLDDPDGIAALNYLCNQYGLDTISTGSVLGLVFDAVRRGIADPDKLGLDSSVALTEQAMELIENISCREGIGNILAEGSSATAEMLNMQGEAPQVKGLDLPGYDPRATAGMCLAYQTADRGGCHLRSFPLGREFSGVLEPGDSIVGKAEFVSTQQNAKAAEECLGLCQFPYGIGINGECIAVMLTACVGRTYSVDDICQVGERIWNLSRLYNAASGISRKDDYLPRKLSSKPLTYGETKGRKMTVETQDAMLDEYYTLRGWDSNGIPGIERIEALGLSAEAAMLRGF